MAILSKILCQYLKIRSKKIKNTRVINQIKEFKPLFSKMKTLLFSHSKIAFI